MIGRARTAAPEIAADRARDVIDTAIRTVADPNAADLLLHGMALLAVRRPETGVTDGMRRTLRQRAADLPDGDLASVQALADAILRIEHRLREAGE